MQRANDKLTVQFLTRCDAYSKRGGDTYQIEMYKKYLEKMGVIVKISYDLSISVDSDVFIIVNTDRPIETVVYYKQLKKRKLLDKTLLLPIHHSFEYIGEFDKKRNDFLGVMLRFINDFYTKEKIKNYLRSLYDYRLLKNSISHTFMNYRHEMSNLLNEVYGVILIAEGEFRDLERDFRIVPKRKFIVKNGVFIPENGYVNNDWDSRSIDVLVCGRIEPRKNSLDIASNLKNENFSVVFAGVLNKNSKGYCKKFLEVVNSSSNMRYVGGIPHQDIPDLFKKSKIHLSASNFEVASLVDLESYAYGCHVISSAHGNTIDYLGDRAAYIYPEKIKDSIRIIKCLIGKETDAYKQFDIMRDEYSWKLSAEKIYDILKEVKCGSVI